MATYRPDGTRIRKRDKKKNRGNVGAGNVGVGTSEPAGNVGVGTSEPAGNVGVETSPPPPAPEPEPAPEPDPTPSGPIVSDDRDAEDAGEVK